VDLDLVLFTIVGGITLLAATGVVVTRNVIYAALFLLAALLGVAGLFVLLYAEFLALVQIFIYGGAIIIVILFALMLTRTTEFQVATENRRAPFAALFSFGLFGVLTYAFIADAARFNTDVRAGIPFVELAQSLFVEWVVPFEIAGLVLLVALIGAVVLARTARNVEEEDAPLPEEEFQPRPVATRGRRTVAAGRRSGGARR
jgi:NADH-quinone oxidoreductase subunit J